MNLFQLILKNMRQRALSTWLTLLSVALGTALGVALLVVQSGANRLFGQAEFGYDLIVGAKGGRLPLVLNTVYQLDDAPGTIAWDAVEAMDDPDRFGPFVRWAVPVAATDEFEGQPVVATTPAMFGYGDDGQARLPDGERFEYRVGRELAFAEGRAFHGRKFEAVLGNAAAEATGRAIGDEISIVHGRPEAGQPIDEHDERWTVVGILEPTGTALDDVAFLPVATSVAIDAHTEAMEEVAGLLGHADHDDHDHDEAAHDHDGDGEPDHAAEDHDAHEDHDHDGDGEPDHAPEDHDAHEDHDHDGDGEPDHAAEDHEGHDHEVTYTVDAATGLVTPRLPQSEWRVSAILVASNSVPLGKQMAWQINNGPDAMAVGPADEMIVFFDTFLKGPSQLLLLVTGLVSVVAGVGILVSIYNSVTARRREVAILRSLGATRRTVLSLITLEAALIGVGGAILGWIGGHTLALAASGYMERRFGEGIAALSIGRWELLYLLGVVAVATLAGLLPALFAYRTPVAQHLSE